MFPNVANSSGLGTAAFFYCKNLRRSIEACKACGRVSPPEKGRWRRRRPDYLSRR
jgi:hypothetical protein